MIIFSESSYVVNDRYNSYIGNGRYVVSSYKPNFFEESWKSILAQNGAPFLELKTQGNAYFSAVERITHEFIMNVRETFYQQNEYVFSVEKQFLSWRYKDEEYHVYVPFAYFPGNLLDLERNRQKPWYVFLFTLVPNGYLDKLPQGFNVDKKHFPSWVVDSIQFIATGFAVASPYVYKNNVIGTHVLVEEETGKTMKVACIPEMFLPFLVGQQESYCENIYKE